jgi:glucose-6-phosphate 1-epimerase
MTATAEVSELDRQFGIPGVVKVTEGLGGLKRVQITGSLAQGEIYLHGAHVTSWKPATQDESLFVSTKSRWEQGQAIRGGVPICFPWFRAKADNSKAPAHGFVRTRMWQLESIIENENGVAVSMSTESDEQTRRWWPAEFHLVHRAVFGTELSLELVCTNTGTTPLRFEEALHTYNRVEDVSQTYVQGLETVRFLDNTDSNKEKTQHGAVTIASQVDNAYVNTQNVVDLIDPKMRRRIRLQKLNSLSTVVWNPWREKGSEMRDLGDSEWNQFLCVEACNILGAAVNLAPGQEHTMTAIISIAKL